MSSHTYKTLGKHTNIGLNTCKETVRCVIITHLCFPYIEACLMMCKKYESAIKRKKQSKEMIFKNLWYLLDRQTDSFYKSDIAHGTE